jgi:elongin-C
MSEFEALGGLDDDITTEKDKMMKMISKEGDIFFVNKEVAKASGTIRTMLSSKGMWAEKDADMPGIDFKEIDSSTLEKVIQYFHYKYRYDNTTDELPPFKVPRDDLLRVLQAAHFLDT